MSTTRSARIRLSAGVACALALGAGTAACSSSAPKTSSTAPPTSAVAGTSVPPGYKPTSKPVPPEALTAITKYLTQHGPPIGTWTITSVELSTVDPAYALYRISPAAQHESEGATGYGFARVQGAKWTALGFGTDAVGCPPGAPDDPEIPAKVLVGFAITCAPAP